MTQVRVFSPVVALLCALVLFAVPSRAEAPPYAVGDMVLGAKDAPVTVIEYASMTCPHCANFI